MKVTFLIKEVQTTKEVPIEYRISSGIVKKVKIKDGKEIPIYYDIRRSTGLSIKARYWNAKEQEAKNEGSFKDEAIKINTRLSDIRNSVEKIQKNDYSNIEKLKAKIDSIVNGEPVNDKLNFFQYVENLTNNYSSKERRISFNQCINIIKDFQLHSGYYIDFETINKIFYEKFITYLNETKKFAPNTRSKHIVSLRYFMNESMECGLHNNKAFKKFSAPKEQAINIYLNDSELQKIFDVDLSDNSRLAKIRDSFLIGCYTGLRFSDFSRITHECINGNFIKLLTEKTGVFVVIPINPNLHTIINKYSVLPSVDIHVINRHMEKIGKLAGVDTKTQKYQKKGLLTTTEILPKYKLIKSHTARRSFATNCYLAGIPIKQIMLITGHKTQEEFFKYLAIGPEENANMLLNHPHFSGAKLKVV